MHINKNHLYHGAALTQIAEHLSFTAINAFDDPSGISRNAFRVNADIAVYLKYSTKPKPPYGEYVFTFTEENLGEIESIGEIAPKVFLALVCVKGRHICCLPQKKLMDLINRRIKDCDGDPEDQYTVLVTLKEGKSFEVYVNKSGRRKMALGKPIIVARNKFPNQLFD